MLMKLTYNEMEQLYSEASVRDYRPEAVLTELSNGSCIPAWCFNLAVPPAPADANSEYVGKLRTLARQLHPPTDYVESIH